MSFFLCSWNNKNKKYELTKSHNNMNNENVILKKKYKIDCDKTVKETDEEKDNEYLNELDKDIKNFYMEKCGEIFNFLKEIHLCRYIDEFLRRGLDLYEEFIEIKEDFLKKIVHIKGEVDYILCSRNKSYE